MSSNSSSEAPPHFNESMQAPPPMNIIRYSLGQEVLDMTIVILFSVVGGVLVSLLGGCNISKSTFFPCDIKLKPILTSVIIPPLLGMVVFGFIARNTFGHEVVAYQDKWAAFFREICLTLLLMRGGMTISFKGKGIIVLLLSVVPQTFETISAAILGHFLFQMPVVISFILGYTLSCVSVSVMVPILMKLLEQGYGKKKGIPASLIASGTFDDIICIMLNGLCVQFAFTKIDAITGEPKESALEDVGFILLEIVVGVVGGVIAALLTWPLKFIVDHPISVWIKYIWCLVLIVLFPALADQSGFTHSKFIAALFFGYTAYQLWGERKPTKQLFNTWFVLQPFLFGTVGAQLLLSQINASMVLNGVIVLLVSNVIRQFAAFMCGAVGNFTMGERLFIGIGWSPKAAVQATLSGAFLSHAKKVKYGPYIQYGQEIQTTAILSIIITAPIASILVNSLGPKLLSKEDEDEPHQIKESQSQKFEDTEVKNLLASDKKELEMPVLKDDKTKDGAHHAHHKVTHQQSQPKLLSGMNQEQQNQFLMELEKHLQKTKDPELLMLYSKFQEFIPS